MKDKMLIFLSYFFMAETTIRALKVAIIVGPLLIIINHHDEIVGYKFTSNLIIKSLLTFLVPYSVSAYSSAKAYSEKREVTRIGE